MPVYDGDPYYPKAQAILSNVLYTPHTITHPFDVEITGQLLGHVTVVEHYTLSFDISIHAIGDTSTYRSLVRVGDTDGIRLPALWFTVNSDTRILVATSACSGGGQKLAYITSGWAADDAPHNFLMHVNRDSNGDGKMEIFVDGVSFGLFEAVMCDSGESMPLYDGDPFYPKAQATLTNVLYDPHTISHPFQV